MGIGWCVTVGIPRNMRAVRHLPRYCANCWVEPDAAQLAYLAWLNAPHQPSRLGNLRISRTPDQPIGVVALLLGLAQQLLSRRFVDLRGSRQQPQQAATRG